MSYLIIGETGESKQITSSDNLKAIYNKHLSSLELSQQSMIIITNKGQEFNSIDSIPFTNDTIYYLYTKQYSNDIMKFFDQSLSKLFSSFSLNVSLNLNSIPDMIKYLPSLESNAKYLKGISPIEIKAICNGMIEFYESFKIISTKMHINCKQSEKFKECYQNQCDGIEDMYKMQSNTFDQYIVKRKEFDAGAARLKEKTDKILKSYDESIEKLKIIELHPALKTAKEKVLADLYFEERKMNEWRDKCIKRFDNSLEYVQGKDQIITKVKASVRNEKNTTIAQLKNEWIAIASEYDKLKREKSSKPLSVITELGNEFNKFKTSLSTIMEIFNSNMYTANPNYVTAVDEAVEYIKSLKSKYSNLAISSLQTYLEPFGELCSRMKKVIETSAPKVNNVINNLIKLKGNTHELVEKINGSVRNLDMVDKDFAYLEMPLFFINAYKESLLEIRRRLIFNHKIQNDISKLNAFVFQEAIFRKQFVNKYDNKVPHQFFQKFLFTDVSLNINFNNGNETTVLPNLLNNEDYEKTIGFLSNGQEDEMDYNNNTGSDYNAENINNHNKNMSNGLEQQKQQQQQVELDLIKTFSNRIQELEMLLKAKDSEMKKQLIKNDQNDKRILSLQSELNSLRLNYDSLSENFLSQLNIKEQRIDKAMRENDNLRKYISSSIAGNKFDTCPMCKESALNSTEYQYCTVIIKECQEKNINNLKQCSKFEKNYNDLLMQTNFIKKTFFIHMNESIEKKNNELNELKAYSERNQMHMEELLTMEKENSSSQINSLKNADENKLKDFNKLLVDYESENKKLKSERDNNMKKLDEMKIQANNSQKEYLLIQAQLDSVTKDYKALESQCDSSKKKEKKCNNDILQFNKEIQKLNAEVEAKVKECEELNKLVEKIKQNHIETMNEVHMVNQSNIEIMNRKNEELIQKNKSNEEIIIRTIEDNKQLKVKLQESYDEISTVKNESTIVKEKLSEKDKRISQLEATITYQNTQITGKETTDITTTFTNSQFLFSNANSHSHSHGHGHSHNNNTLIEEMISYKKIEKGTKCIFVPHSEGIYVCINLSQNINSYNEEDRNKFFKCQYILNLNSFDEELKELIVDNSLIVIGKVSHLTQHSPTENDNPYNLPEDNSYTMVTLDHPDYVIGFPGEEMIFRNYVCFN